MRERPPAAGRSVVLPGRPRAGRSRLLPPGALAALAVALLVLFAGAWMLDAFVRSTLYPAPPVRVPSPPPAPLRELRLPLAGAGAGADAASVVAWLRRGGADDGAGRPLVLWFHGNGENLETMRLAGLFDELAALGVDVLAVDYPGYGGSPGVPTEAGLLASGEAALRWAREGGAEWVIAAGWSLGAAVAVQLAARHPDLAGVVALSPWTSLGDVARLHFPAWLTRLALDEAYDSLAVAPRLAMPALVVHGAADAIIPAAHGEQLAAALPAARWVPVARVGHNDLLGEGVVWRELAGFVAAVSES